MLAMEKRGQVSVFVIIGVVLLIVIALVWFLRSEVGVGVAPLDYLNDKSEPLKKQVEACLSQSLPDSLDSFSHQGGFFSPESFVLYESYLVPFYCSNIPDEDACLNVMPSLDRLENNLNLKVQGDLRDCVGEPEDGFGYDVSIQGELTTILESRGDSATLTVDYPVVFSGKGSEVKFDPFSVSLSDLPLGDLYGVAHDSINSQARDGEFFQLIYMLDKKGSYEIEVDKPFPHTIYKVNKKNSDFSFWFAVEGEA